MYEDRKETFSIKDVVLQILFVALFIFLLIWLFPSKSFVNKKVDPLLDTIFNQNVMAMKDAAKSYFTTPRLPQNTGDKVTMTLAEMLDKNIILPFTDKYGKECDVNESYVEITKQDEEYVMKVNLKCSEQEDYILVHMGCYDYCSTTICEKQDEDIVDSNDKPVTPVTPDTSKYICKLVNGKYYDKNGNAVTKEEYDKSCGNTDPEPTYSCQIIDGKYYDKAGNIVSKEAYEASCIIKPKEYECEYAFEKDGYYTEWSDWSDWTTTELVVKDNEKDIKKVEKKTETKTENKEVFAGYDEVEYYDGSKPIYELRSMVTSRKTTTYCAYYGWREKTSTTTKTCTTTKGELKYMGTFETTQKVSSSGADVYEYVGSKDYPCDENCSVATTYIYKWYVQEYETTCKESTQEAGGEYGCLKEYTETTPYYSTVKVLTGYEKSIKKVPVYITVPVDTVITYYRQSTRSFVPGTSDVQWDTCENSSLIDKGYVFTGNKREKTA